MIDYLLTDEFDLSFSDGDLQVGVCDRQNQEMLLLVEKGELREYPTRGVGIATWLDDETEYGTMSTAVKREFELDGMSILLLKIQGLDIQIEATYG